MCRLIAGEKCWVRQKRWIYRYDAYSAVFANTDTCNCNVVIIHGFVDVDLLSNPLKIKVQRGGVHAVIKVGGLSGLLGMRVGFYDLGSNSRSILRTYLRSLLKSSFISLLRSKLKSLLRSNLRFIMGRIYYEIELIIAFQGIEV